MKPRDDGRFSHPRLDRELKTVRAMIAIYCRDMHRQGQDLCSGCFELADYAARRLANCPWAGEKHTCGTCVVHCYKPEMREKIKAVMRHSGPKMILYHPVLALRHLIDERRGAGSPGGATKDTEKGGGNP